VLLLFATIVVSPGILAF